MKKFITVFAVVCCFVMCISSCKKDDDKSISLSPSSLTLSVGDSKAVSVNITGYSGYVQYKIEYPQEIVDVTPGTDGFTVEGIAKGNGTIQVYLIDDPNISASMSINVTK